MRHTEYKVLRAPISVIEGQMQTLLDEGWQPVGYPVAVAPFENEVFQALAKSEGETDTVTGYKVVRLDLDAVGEAIGKEIEDGWQPYGGPLVMPPRDKEIYQALVRYE